MGIYIQDSSFFIWYSITSQMKTIFKVQTACNLYVELFKDLMTLKPIHLRALCVLSFAVFLHPQRLQTLKPAFAFDGIH